jgi:osmotically inducible lipoprotein OsmB
MHTLTRRNSAAPLRIALAAVCLIALGACTNMTHTQQRVVSGAALGAAAGLGVTAATGGCISCGAAIGTAVGAGVGYIVDRANQ